MAQPHCRQTALLDDSTPRSLDSRPSNALTSSDFHIISPILSRCGNWLAGGHLPQRTVRSPGHVAIEEIRSGTGSGGGDLLGLLLLFSLAANVAQGAELGAPPGAEAGASAGPNELFVKRPEACSPALRSWSPLSCPHHRCTDSRCIKDLKSRPLPS